MQFDLKTVAAALGGEVKSGQVRAPGPDHSRTDRSLSIRIDCSAPDGFVVHSFAGDDPICCKDYVRQKLGLANFKPKGTGNHHTRRSEDVIAKAMADAIESPTTTEKPKGAVVAKYNYTDENGALLYQVLRYEPKNFRQRRPNGRGGWLYDAGDRKVLYRWPELIHFPDATVFVCEGEKDADRVASLGHCATTVAAGKWTDDCIKALAGRDCLILEDNDKAGREKALEVAAALHGTAKSIRIVRLSDLAEKGDVSDWLDADPRRAEKLTDICFDAPLWEPKANAPDADHAGAIGLDVNAFSIPWWCKPATIPPREFLYGRHYMRKAIGATVGAGGRAKTTQGAYEAISMAVGRDLATGTPLPSGALRVWLVNGEEDQNELDRRLAATCQRYGITEKDLGGRLFAKSVRANPLRIATLVKSSPTINRPIFDFMLEFIQRNRIDVFMVDPLISFHAVSENDNNHMDVVIKEGYGTIADQTNSAGEVFHHPGKPKPGHAETVVEDARGASAVIWAARSARVFNFMTTEEASRLGIKEDERRLHIRISNGKANAGPIGTANWIKLGLENLPNGDLIACSGPWTPPDPLEGLSTHDMEAGRELARGGEHRADSRSPKWFGYALAKQLGLNVACGADNDPQDIAKLKGIIRTWVKSKALEIVERQDDVERKKRKFIVAGSFEAKPDDDV